MKIMTRLLFLCLALGFIANTANAQQPFGVPIENGAFNGLNYTEGPVNNGPIGAEWQSATWPGIMWASVTGANQGLGYEDTYFTLGAKTHLYEDCFRGRWNVEGRVHFDVDDGRFFGNLGLERGFTIEPANTDVYVSIWYDSDNDYLQGGERHFHQVGISGKLKNPLFDIYANGYIPVADREFIIGSGPDGVFFQNLLLAQPGFEIGLEGFDMSARIPLPDFAMFGASLDLGGYYYTNSTQFVPGFGGFRGQLNLKTMNGLALEGGITQDGVFDTTWILRVVWEYGGGAAYDPRGRDLERTQRNDHIVRVQQTAIIATNPKTGQPFNVVHVDNTAGAGGDGTFERPVNTLTAAQAVSNPNDIIFVRNQGNIDYNAGIQLQACQQLLGAGVNHVVQTNEVANFVIPALDANVPVIDTPGVGIGLASDTTVRGFSITGAATAIQANNVGVGDVNIPAVVDQVSMINSGVGNALVNGVAITGGSETINFLDSDPGNTAITTIENVTGTAFAVNGGTGTTNYAGNITQNGVGELVNISALGNGGTVRFTSGTLAADGAAQGVTVANNLTGATVSFDDVNIGTATRLTSNGVNLNNNNNATTTFNALDIRTTGAVGFASNAGGNIIVNGGANAIDALGGTALNISNNSSANTNINFATITKNNGIFRGIDMQNNTAGTYNLGTVNLQSTGGTGFLAANNGGTSRINTNAASVVTTTLSRAVDIRNSSGNFLFQNVTGNNGGNMIRLSNLGNNGGNTSTASIANITLNQSANAAAVEIDLGGTGATYAINGGNINFAGNAARTGVDIDGGNNVNPDNLTLAGINIDYNNQAVASVGFNFVGATGGNMVGSAGNTSQALNGANTRFLDGLGNQFNGTTITIDNLNFTP